MKKQNSQAKAHAASGFNKMSIVTLIIGLIVGFLAGFLSFYRSAPEEDLDEYAETRAGGYRYINPLLECDNFRPSKLQGLAQLKDKVKEYVQSALKDYRVEHVSIYFRDLNNGPWVGINEHDNFTPASLLKVPILIAAYKIAERDTGFLNQTYHYTNRIDTGFQQFLGHEKRLEIGQTYTVSELIEYMIIHSDNDAKEILLPLITDETMMQVFTDLGVSLKGKDLSQDFISVKEYSSFFRILYNASYLNREMSEKALELLTHVQFKKGLPARLPGDIEIAHKFGERGSPDTPAKQLHDCGIVYLPDSPYLLCIMTKGTNYDTMVGVIADISEIFYNHLKQ